MKTEKIISVILIGIIACSFFAGCGQKSNETTSNDANNKPKTEAEDETKLSGSIEMWSTFTDIENKVLKEKIVPAFNNKYPNIKVKITPMPGGDDYKKQILQACMSGTTPDLARTDITDVAQYAKEDYLAAIDELPNFNELKDSVFEGPMSTSYYNGHYYGIPLDTNTKIAIYNKRLLEKAGMNEAPKTMDEFQQLAEKLKGNKVMGIGISGIGTWNMAPYFLSLGGKITDKENSKASGFLNSPESVKALEKIVEWNNNGYAAKSILGGEGSWEGFNAAHYAMIDDGPWWFPANKEQKEVKDNVIFATIPKGDGGSVSVVGGEDTIIFKASKNQAQAYAFAKFLASDEAQTIFATELNMMPVCKETSKKSVVTDNNMMKVYIEQLSTAWARTPSPAWADIDKAISEAFEKAVRKKAAPQQALDEAAKKIDELLKTK